jgi:hypothetical protein
MKREEVNDILIIISDPRKHIGEERVEFGDLVMIDIIVAIAIVI